MRTTSNAANDWVEKESITKNTYETARAFRAGVEFAQAWIDINDELPEIKDDECSDVVLCKEDDCEHPITCVYLPLTKEWLMVGVGIEINVTHWRPIDLK